MKKIDLNKTEIECLLEHSNNFRERVALFILKNALDNGGFNYPSEIGNYVNSLSSLSNVEKVKRFREIANENMCIFDSEDLETFHNVIQQVKLSSCKKFLGL